MTSTSAGDDDTTAAGANGVALVELVVADPPEAWATAGFTVVDDRVAIGDTTIRLVGRTDGQPAGIRGWTLRGIGFEGGELDGLPTLVAAPTGGSGAGTPVPHPNGCIGLDHVVVSTPDLERSIEAFEAVGMQCRRIRHTESYGAPMRQAFFRMGPTILEVVSGDTGGGQPAEESPSAWFGLAVDVDDLDATGAVLGDGLGTIKAAVQPGRRIATLRHKALGLSVPVAAMDHRADEQPRDHGDDATAEHGGSRTGR